MSWDKWLLLGLLFVGLITKLLFKVIRLISWFDINRKKDGFDEENDDIMNKSR